MVCTVFLMPWFRSSLRNTAKMMGHTKPMVSLSKLMTRVLRRVRKKLGSLNRDSNCLKPTHSLMPGKSPMRNSWKDMIKPYMGR